jgi:hypothetical protein
MNSDGPAAAVRIPALAALLQAGPNAYLQAGYCLLALLATK